MRRFRLLAVRIALLLTVVVGAIAYALDPVVAHGWVMGGVAGVLAFWIVATRMERLATDEKVSVYSVPVWWTFMRLAFYALVLARAYTLDRETFRGLFAAAAGLFVIRMTVVFLGLTGIDLKKSNG